MEFKPTPYCCFQSNVRDLVTTLTHSLQQLVSSVNIGIIVISVKNALIDPATFNPKTLPFP